MKRLSNVRSFIHGEKGSSPLNNIRKDYLIVKDELNWLYRFTDKELYNEYLLYNLNTKPISFDIFLVTIATVVLLPLRLLYFIYIDISTGSHPVEFKIMNALVLLAVLAMCFLGWMYVLERLFPKNKFWKKLGKKMRSLSRGKYSLKVFTTTPRSNNDDDDDESSREDEDEHPSKHLSYSTKNLYQGNNNQSGKADFGHMKAWFSLAQHLLLFSIMTFNISFFVTNCIQENCVDYHNLILNEVLQNCHHPNYHESNAYTYGLILMLTPIFFYCVFRECLYELHMIQQLIIMIFAILYVSYFQFSILRIVVLLCLGFGSFCLLIDLHIHNVAAFLTNHQLREMLLEKERNADKQAAEEMRHMIGNVAHDLKTVRIIIALISFGL
jgi:hypothetical protein